MENNFKKETEHSVKNTFIYGGPDLPVEPIKGNNSSNCINIAVDGLDTVKSLFEHKDGKTAVLNFASYKNPGGKYLDGSSAQEECLCHSSNLYNVISKFPDYYKWNNDHKNKALYTNRALYSKNVVFVDDSVCVYGAEPIQVTADVITCAAPNYTAAAKYAGVDEKDNNIELYSRIKFILDIAEHNKVDTLILGAFGCGVFGQDANTVASLFQLCLSSYDYHFKNVYFSVLNVGNGLNYECFQKMFAK